MFRKASDLLQREVAEAIGISRSRLAHWENESEPVPEAFIEPIAKALNISPRTLQALHGSAPARRPRLQAGVRRMHVPVHLPAYPVKGTFSEMLGLCPLATTLYQNAKQILSPAACDELSECFPRDTPSELLAACQLLYRGAVQTRLRLLDDLGFRKLVVLRDQDTYSGSMFRHALVLRLSVGETLVAIPQVSIVVAGRAEVAAYRHLHPPHRRLTTEPRCRHCFSM